MTWIHAADSSAELACNTRTYGGLLIENVFGRAAKGPSEREQPVDRSSDPSSLRLTMALPLSVTSA